MLATTHHAIPVIWEHAARGGRVHVCSAKEWRSDLVGMRKNVIKTLNRVRLCKGYMPAVVFTESDRNRSVSDPLKILFMIPARQLTFQWDR